MNSKLLLSFCMLMASCTPAIKPVTVVTQETPRPKLEITKPEPIELKEVKITISKEGPIRFCLDEVSYKNLIYNWQEIRSYIEKQNEVIRSYKEYYEKH